MLPSNLSQLAQSFKLAKLSLVISVSQTTRAQAITQTKGDIVLLHDFTNLFEAGV